MTLSVSQPICDRWKIAKLAKIAYFGLFLHVVTSKNFKKSNFFLDDLKLFWGVLWGCQHPRKICPTTLSVFRHFYECLKMTHIGQKRVKNAILSIFFRFRPFSQGCILAGMWPILLKIFFWDSKHVNEQLKKYSWPSDKNFSLWIFFAEIGKISILA